MAEHAANQSEIYGLMAQFQEPEELVRAADQVTAAGYRLFDAYAPYPLPGLSEAMRLPRTIIPLLVLLGAVFGAAAGYFMQWYSAAIAYPHNAGGRPYHSWPLFIPITFEMAILFAALTAVLALILLNRLPQPYHPVFNAPGFKRASQDRFFLCIEGRDPLFEPARTRQFLESLGPLEVSEVAP